MECDSCHYEMPDKVFRTAVSCGCDICGPWTICKNCHVQIKEAIIKRTKAIPA